MSPEFRWPTTPATFASTSFCATVVPTLGSAWSSSPTIVELDRLAADLIFACVRFVDREARAVLVVLAQVRDAAGERADVADLDFLRSGRRALVASRGLGIGLCGRLAGCSPQPRGRQRRGDSVTPTFVIHAILPGVAWTRL